MTRNRKEVNYGHHGRDKGSEKTEFIAVETTELLPFLLANLSGFGRNKIKALLSRGQVSVDGRVTTQFNDPIASGMRVAVDWAMVVKTDPIRGLRILFEDSDLIVIDKEAGLLSIATDDDNQPTAYRLLTDHVRRGNPKNRIFIVHRLDRDTSGVMLFAKTEQAKKRLQDAWRDTVEERIYVALVEGRVSQAEGTIVSWLKETNTLKMYSSETPNGGQKAVTHFKVIRAEREYSLLEVQLETGRKNQIRVHLQDIGHSVVGDKKYGSLRNPIGRLGLHARVIALHHPTTAQVLRFESPLPDTFLRVFE